MTEPRLELEVEFDLEFVEVTATFEEDKSTTSCWDWDFLSEDRLMSVDRF